MLYDQPQDLYDYDLTDGQLKALQSRSNAFVHGHTVDSFAQQLWRVMHHKVPDCAVLLLPPLVQHDVPMMCQGVPLFMRQDVVRAALGQQTLRHHRHHIQRGALRLLPDAIDMTPLVIDGYNYLGSQYVTLDLADRHGDPIVAAIQYDEEGTDAQLYIQALYGKESLVFLLGNALLNRSYVATNARTEDYLQRIGADEVWVRRRRQAPISVLDLTDRYAHFYRSNEKGLDPSLSLHASLGLPVPHFKQYSDYRPQGTALMDCRTNRTRSPRQQLQTTTPTTSYERGDR